VASNRLRYFNRRPREGDYLNDFSARGYIDLTSACECKPIEKKGDGGLISGSIGKFCFRLKEGSTILIFSATSDAERNEWVFLIQEAIRGVSHTLTLSTPPVTAAPAEVRRKSAIGKRNSNFEVIYPRMVGVLKKKSIEGKKFGFKNIKTRYNRNELFLVFDTVGDEDTLFQTNFLFTSNSLSFSISISIFIDGLSHHFFFPQMVSA
jgi:hypothetical protein